MVLALCLWYDNNNFLYTLQQLQTYLLYALLYHKAERERKTIMNKTTNKLNLVLQGTKPEQLSEFFNENEGSLISSDQPFAEYMRLCIRRKGLIQQEVFINADLSEGYGYKIISGEKHTRKRDTILRLCFGAHFSLEETQRALKIYGMSPLYSRMPRDAVLMVALNNKIYELLEVNSLLRENKMVPLQGTQE